MGLAELYQENKKAIELSKEANKIIKEEIIGVLQEANLNEIHNEIYIVKYSIPKLFDAGLFKMENPELAKQFVKEETITKVKDVIDKKGILKHYPAIYNKNVVADTPRLSVKGGF